MKLRHYFLTALAVLAIAVGASARADTIVNRNVMVGTPSVPMIETLSLTSAGALTVTVTDLLWPQALQSLSFAITNNQGVLESMSGAGQLTYNATGPMTLFANVFAVSNSLAGSGGYHINVSFSPSVVPLPGALWLLLSGIFGMASLNKGWFGGFLFRKHATVTNSVVQ
jgi:hypothetical protein